MSVLYLPFSLTLSATLLAGGYALDKNWMGVAALAALAIFWLVGRRFHRPWLNSALLVGYVSAAAAGIFLGISAHWMIAGSAFALAAWELDSEDWAQANDSTQPWRELLQRKTLPLLVISVGLGLLAAELLLFVRISISFGVMLLAALVGIVSLTLFFRSFANRVD